MSRTVLVTGGASGIGKGIARAFVANGDRVVIADIDGESGAAASVELGCDAVQVDIADAHSVADAVERVGSIDVLVNNAGLIAIGGLLVDLTPDDFDRVVHVNFRGTFLMTQAVARQMIGGGVAGAIVNVTSIGARQPTRALGAYEATKAAVEALTRSAALEFAQHGIRVNAVAPGPVLTEMLRGAMPEGSPARTAWQARIPLGRMAEVDDVAPVTVFLASPGAQHITGASVQIDGGQLLT
ncbi:MAG: SDR family oxidoreductase [Salinibacterium sp.]|nr:SDR family oxidoreductase [Salinibacterium sp.]